MTVRTVAFTLALAAFLWFFHLMVLITWQYVPIDFSAAFLRLKTDEIIWPHYQWAFFSHVYTSIFVLALGAPQFIKSIRDKYPRWHRVTGILYILLIIFVAAPTGLIMGYYANGGPWSQLSFCLQAILWWWFTWRAWRLALTRDWNGHRAFMLRSFALTLSAVSLRAWKWLIVALLAPPPMDTYRVVAWLGWLGNLLLVEAWLWRARTQDAGEVEKAMK